MSSMIRNMQRRMAKKATDYEPRDPAYRLHADNVGYSVLTPTKGWRHFSARRLRAQALLSQISHRTIFQTI